LAIKHFIPEIWSNQILARLNDASSFLQVANRNYEGEASKGNTVKINEVGPVTVNTYTDNSTSDLTWEFLTDAQKELKIDQFKYFAFAVDDVDRLQARPDVMAEAIKNATWALRDNIDAALAATYSQAGVTYGSTGSGIDVNSNAVFKVFNYISHYLDTYNCPKNGRWCVCPPWFYYALLAKKLDVDKGQVRGDLEMGGFRGQYLGYNVYTSNNITNGNVTTNAKVMFGGPEALSLVVQMDTVEAVRPSKAFHDLVKGLLVYGYKVVRPNHLATLTCDYTAESTS